MSANQLLAVKIAEKLLDALPFRGGVTAERTFVAKSAVIILEHLNSIRKIAEGSDMAIQHQEMSDSIQNELH